MAGESRRLLGNPGVWVIAISLILPRTHLANGDILPGNDATANVRLAGKLVAKHKLTSTPQEEAFMFKGFEVAVAVQDDAIAVGDGLGQVVELGAAHGIEGEMRLGGEAG